MEATTYEDYSWCNAWYVVALAVAMGIYARDLASMEAQQKDMIFDLWNLCSIISCTRCIHILGSDE